MKALSLTILKSYGLSKSFWEQTEGQTDRPKPIKCMLWNNCSKVSVHD